MAAPATATLSAQQQLQLLQKALDGPAMAPPPGVKPNFVNPPNLEKELYIDLILCLTIAVLVVCMRMWTKARLMGKVQIEDCKSCAAWFAYSSSPCSSSSSPCSSSSSLSLTIHPLLFNRDRKQKAWKAYIKVLYRGLCIGTCKYGLSLHPPTPCNILWLQEEIIMIFFFGGIGSVGWFRWILCRNLLYDACWLHGSTPIQPPTQKPLEKTLCRAQNLIYLF